MLRIEAFGELKVVRDADQVSAWEAAPEARALLALLAVRGRIGVSRAWAHELFAAEDDDTDWWRTGTTALRALLGAAVVAANDEHIALPAGQATSDVAEFRAAIAEGALERAVSLHHARLADGLHFREAPRFDQWLTLQRETLESEAASALERLAEEAEERGEPLRAVRWWRQLAMRYPLNERIAASLMEALVRAGDREGAMRHARFVEALALERIDRPADAEVLALAGALRAGGDAAGGDALAPLRRALRSRYRIAEEIGRGGNGLVLRAHDIRHDRPVAIKVLHPDLAPALGSARFAREVRVVASLQHPNILPLYDSGTVAGIPYYVMPYVAGGSLRARLDLLTRLDAADALAIAGQVARALAAAHARGVVHRDVKPENILLVDGHPLLADFGIACVQQARPSGPTGLALTAPGLVVGTPEYMSPEQGAAGAEVDGRADQYSLGCVLWQMLTGSPPYTGRSAGLVMAAHASAPVPDVREQRPELPDAVHALLRRALAKAPAERFPGMDAFAAALDGVRMRIQLAPLLRFDATAAPLARPSGAVS